MKVMINAITAFFTVGAVFILPIAYVLITGTLLWFLFPYFTEAFPSLTSDGYLPSSISWWTFVAVVWVFKLVSIMFRSKMYYFLMRGGFPLSLIPRDIKELLGWRT